MEFLPINQALESPPVNKSVESPPVNQSMESQLTNQLVESPPPALPSSPLRRRTNIPELPEEILLNIFSRLPTKWVARYRMLSTLWRRNLSTPQFIRSHANRKPNEEDVFLISRDFHLNTISIPLNTYRVKINLDNFPMLCYEMLGSCQGLVMLSTEYTDQDNIIVLNPIDLDREIITETARAIYPFAESIYYGFGYDSSRDDYKIVSLSHHFNRSTHVDVYSLREGEWEEIDFSPYDHNFTNKQHGVFLNGAIHWLVGDNDNKLVIAAFDLATATFREIPAPNGKGVASYGLHVVGGCLFMVDTYAEDILDIWIMKQYGLAKSWTNFSTTLLPGRTLYSAKPVCFIEEKEVVILSGEGELFACNLENGAIMKEVIIDGPRRRFCDGGNFMGSFLEPSEIMLPSHGSQSTVIDQGSQAE